MCVHSSLDQTYWSDIGHGVINAMRNTSISELIMNVRTCASDGSTCTMLYVTSVCLI
jgi:hypothetical protein